VLLVVWVLTRLGAGLLWLHGLVVILDLVLVRRQELGAPQVIHFGEVRSVLENDMFIDLDDDDFNG
jgi:hypothetical protein